MPAQNTSPMLNSRFLHQAPHYVFATIKVYRAKEGVIYTQKSYQKNMNLF